MALNIAHRGFSSRFPENTMLAFEKALEVKCDGIETDVQLTKDNVPVLLHDETLERTSDGNGFLKDYTYSQLIKLNFGKGQRISTLEEFIEFSKEKDLFINIELKNSIIPYENLEVIVLQLLEKYKFPKNKVILSSFNHYSMVNIKTIDKSIRTGLLYDSWIYNPGHYGLSCGADAMHPQFYAVLNKEFVSNIKKMGLKINTYTVNAPEYMKKLLELNIDGIITNNPDVLNSIIDNKFC